MKAPSWNSLQIEQALRAGGYNPKRRDGLRVTAQGLTWFEVRSPRTTTAGRMLTADKQSARLTLLQQGIPAPQGEYLPPSATEAQIISAAQRVGWPLAVKPSHGSMGAGITLDVTNVEQLGKAVKAARKLRPKQGVVLERSVTGAHYRVLWASEAVCSVIHCKPWGPTGDGTHTVQQLIERENRRRELVYIRAFAVPIGGVVMLEQLGRQGLTLSSVPEPGRKVDIAYSLNIRQGAIAVEVTGSVPQRVIDVTRQAIEAIPGLDHGATDIVDDGETAWVIEVNANPGLGTHIHPYEGEPQQGLVDRLVRRVHG